MKDITAKTFKPHPSQKLLPEQHPATNTGGRGKKDIFFFIHPRTFCICNFPTSASEKFSIDESIWILFKSFLRLQFGNQNVSSSVTILGFLIALCISVVRLPQKHHLSVFNNEVLQWESTKAMEVISPSNTYLKNAFAIKGLPFWYDINFLTLLTHFQHFVCAWKTAVP